MQWPHAPVHWTFDSGTYMLTAGTYLKAPLLSTSASRDLVCSALFALAPEYGLTVRAWAVLLNHYHVILSADRESPPIQAFVRRFHGVTAKALNDVEGVRGRKVWYQYWDSHITYEASLLARLKYVHNNPVHHSIVNDAEHYRWCSAAWFGSVASPAFAETVRRMKVDTLHVQDDF